MSEGSVSYEATFDPDYDPGIFFIPGAGIKISQPNIDSIFSLSAALGKATELLESAESIVTSVSGGKLSFDSGAVADFSVNTAVEAAQKAIDGAIPEEVIEATSFLSQFNPQELLSISTFNGIAKSLGAPQELISMVAGLSSGSLGTLSSLVSSTLQSLPGTAVNTVANLAGGAVNSAVGGSLGSVAGYAASTLAGGVASKVLSALAGSLGKSAAKLAGGELPSSETWSLVFGSSFNPDLTPFLNLTLGQAVPPIGQFVKAQIAGRLFGQSVRVRDVNVPVLAEVEPNGA